MQKLNSKIHLIPLKDDVIDFRTLQSRRRTLDDYFTYALDGDYHPGLDSYGTLTKFLNNCFEGLQGNHNQDVILC